MMKIFDGHNDTLTHLEKRSFFKKSAIGQLDLPRARVGGLAGGMFSIFVPPQKNSPEADDVYGFSFSPTGYSQTLRSPIPIAYAKQFTDTALDFLRQLQGQSHGACTIVTSYKELLTAFDEKCLAIVVHFEGAEAIDADLSNLELYYQKGLRALGLVWSRPNVFGNGVPFAFPHSPDIGEGLTHAGKKLVRACNRLGIMIDCAHCNEKGFWDVAKISDKPLVVSHTDAFALCPSTRNITDEQIDAIGKSDGIVGINFEPMGTSFSVDYLRFGSIDVAMKRLERVPLSDIADHIDYVVDRIGIDYVGFGSDFDGADMPVDLTDVAGLPKLVSVLQKRGFDAEALEKIAYRNWFRVIQNTWK